MTKKNYIQAAEMVKDMRKYNCDVANEVELVFIKFFQNDNPRFDQVRFSEACSLEVR